MQYAFDFGECFASVDHVRRKGAPGAKPPRPPARRPVALPCIPGLERTRKDTLFFGLQPDAAAAGDIEQWLIPPVVQRHGLTGDPLGRSRWHVTLLGLGGYDGVPRTLAATAGEAAARLAAAGFDVRFDRVGSFRRRGRPAPLVLLGREAQPALHDFRRSLAGTMKCAGLRVSQGRTFTPHLTLLYDTRMVAEHAVPPVAWHAREFVLIHSLHGHGQHVVLGRWPLHG